MICSWFVRDFFVIYSQFVRNSWFIRELFVIYSRIACKLFVRLYLRTRRTKREFREVCSPFSKITNVRSSFILACSWTPYFCPHFLVLFIQNRGKCGRNRQWGRELEFSRPEEKSANCVYEKTCKSVTGRIKFWSVWILYHFKLYALGIHVCKYVCVFS